MVRGHEVAFSVLCILLLCRVRSEIRTASRLNTK